MISAVCYIEHLRARDTGAQGRRGRTGRRCNGGGTITMKHTLKSGLTIGMLVAALALTGGCGDNDNSGNFNDNGNDNGNDNTPISTRTATPGPVVTPTGVA